MSSICFQVQETEAVTRKSLAKLGVKTRTLQDKRTRFDEMTDFTDAVLRWIMATLMTEDATVTDDDVLTKVQASTPVSSYTYHFYIVQMKITTMLRSATTK